MITDGARTFWFAAVACSGVLAACGNAPDPSEAAPAATTKSAAPKRTELPPDMVAAVSSGKTATVVGVHFALRAVPAVNQALPVDIAIVPHRDFIALQAHFESRDGLALTVGEVLAPQTDAKAEKTLKHQLVLLPTRDGVFMVTAIIETDSADGTVTRVFSIPVIVAPTDAAAQTVAPAADVAPGNASAAK
jgi:hypothetical protein